MGTKKGYNSGGTRRGGAGGATATVETRIPQNTDTGSRRRRARSRPHAGFPAGPPSRLHLAGGLLLWAGRWATRAFSLSLSHFQAKS